MADYFSEYSSFVGAKGLPSPADTPYEIPAFIRSKRSSHVAGNSREQSVSPPLPPDTTEFQEKPRDGRYSALDPRRITPTLHASLVSEILNLRRELDSKNHLVEDLETNLSNAKTENETLNGQLAESSKEVRKAKHQVTQMEKGVYEAVEDLVKERDSATAALDELKSKLDVSQKKTRQQDEDAVRSQSIWENEKESWDNERRQLERRVHVTETRLRAVVDEMAMQQVQVMQIEEHSDDTTFKDSGLGEGSDTASIRSATPVKHRRNLSSVSFRPRNTRTSISSQTTTATPDLYARPGQTLADELNIDEEDEYDDESEHAEDEFDFAENTNRAAESRQSSTTAEVDVKSRRALFESPTNKSIRKQPRGIAPAKAQYQDRATTPPPVANVPVALPKPTYVDTGYQPSPPSSPPRVEVTNDEDARALVQPFLGEEVRTTEIELASTVRQPSPGLTTSIGGSPISPPQTPVIDGVTWLDEKSSPAVAPTYSTVSTQTDFVEPERSKSHTPKRESLSPPAFVPSIAIHPPTSRPSSPRPYVLPPGTKNASAQANLGWPCKDASVQTEEIRIDRRPVKLPNHLLPSSLLPSPTFQEHPRPKQPKFSNGVAKIFTKIPPIGSNPASPGMQSPTESSPEMLRNNSPKDLRHYPLKALPLPRPVLSPVLQSETFQSNGPLNRSSQYGVSQHAQAETQQHLADVDQWSEHSDYEDVESDMEVGDIAGSIPALSRPPPGRFGLSEPPKAVPEDKEISPERRPDTSDSIGAAPAPSVTSSRPTSQRRHVRHPSKHAKQDTRKDGRSRSPSFGSMASSSYSTYSGVPMPPYPIPLRSSSRIYTKSHSEGSHSPTPQDVFGPRNSRSGRSHSSRQISLRKVQSAAVIRNRSGKGSPSKHRRRRQSPELTPVQSMAFESPAPPTKFPIPELPTPLQDSLTFDYIKGTGNITMSPETANSPPRASEETSLVDAIAGTMVGEWMWKYIRKRKSFGIGEDTSEFPVGTDANGVVNITGHGTRHKRWVWLSPYERTIMWDNKQPTSGTALLGKKGRKLAIQSVLDVEDPTTLPKGSELSSAWKRSILILTPERALKFTATTEERHMLWMTALSFLSQSGQLPTRIPQKPMKDLEPPIPPVPAIPSTSIDGVPIKRHRSPSFGKSTVRDSIRLAKGKKPEPKVLSSHLQDQNYGLDFHDFEQADSADFPAVPRLYVSTSRHHSRKRSNTSPRLSQPMNQIRTFSSSVVGSATASGGGGGSTSNHDRGSTVGGSSFRPSASSKSGSRQESIPSLDRPNFFEAVGTVRMEAFVDPNVRDGVLYVPAPPPPAAGVARRPRRGSNLSQSTVDKKRIGYVFDEDGIDPFHGF